MSKPKKIDISVIFNLHHEGLIAFPSMKSIIQAVSYARSKRLKIEVIGVADRPDSQTRNFLRKTNKNFDQVLIVDNGDLGISRNCGVAVARGKYIAFMDGDDLTSRNWYYKAFCIAESLNSPAIIHPEVNGYFGRAPMIYRHRPQDEMSTLFEMIDNNPWTALSFAAREIFISNPYSSNDIANGYGYEDWHWNCETLAMGVDHVIAPGTCHFIRQKRVGSLVQQTLSQTCVIKKTKLVEPFGALNKFNSPSKFQMNKIEKSLRKLIAKELKVAVKHEGAINQLRQKNLLFVSGARVYGLGKLLEKTLNALQYSDFNLVCCESMDRLIEKKLMNSKLKTVVFQERRYSKTEVKTRGNCVLVCIGKNEAPDLAESFLLNAIVQMTPKKLILAGSILGDSLCELYSKIIFGLVPVELWVLPRGNHSDRWEHVGFPNYSHLLIKTLVLKGKKSNLSQYYSA